MRGVLGLELPGWYRLLSTAYRVKYRAAAGHPVLAVLNNLYPQWMFFSRITARSHRSMANSINAAASASPKFIRKK